MIMILGDGFCLISTFVMSGRVVVVVVKVVGCIPPNQQTNQSLALTSYSFAAPLPLAAQLLHRSIFKYTLLTVVVPDHSVVVNMLLLLIGAHKILMLRI